MGFIWWQYQRRFTGWRMSAKSFLLFLLRKTVVRRVLRLVFGLAFDRRYLVGRHFDQGFGGWVWALKGLWFQKVLGFNRAVPWPVDHRLKISNFRNIRFHPDDLDNFQSPGCYFQNANAMISIGFHSPIAPNVGLITSNHDAANPDRNLPGEDIVIGDHCWIGMNAVILPGVILGEHTVVGAGAVVTRSFPDGWCVVAGVPASVVRRIDGR